MDNNKPRVVIGIATYSGLEIRTFVCYDALDKSQVQPLLAVSERVIIDRARNGIANEALKADADYLLFIDDDMTFEPDALNRLIERDKDIVAGMFFGRVEPSMHLTFEYRRDSITGQNQYEKYDIDKLLEHEEKGECFECYATGTGFTLINTRVLKAMAEEDPEKPFFETRERGENKCSEDVFFCDRAQKLGFKVWCDTQVKVGHIGTKVWGFDEFKPNAEKYKRMIESNRRLQARKYQEENNIKEDDK